MAEILEEMCFLSGPGTLLELNLHGPVFAALTPAWEREIGTTLSFGGDGLNATGYHRPSGPGERTMTLMRPTSDEAVEEAVRLIQKKHDLNLVVRLADNGFPTKPASDADWDAAFARFESKPFSETAISIWRG